MRPLCGAIITAGALIGLGLAAIGVGLRYQSYPYLDPTGNPQWVLFRHLDTSLMLVIVSLGLVLLIGLGTAFLGLAYHHHKRHLELTREHARLPGDRVSA
jgi:hypothetical protein